MSEPGGRERRWILALALVAAALTLWPAAPPWAAVVGDPLGETDNHLWMLWREIQHLLGWRGPTANAPAGIDLPLMDPLNLPPLALLWPLGPAIAWNGLILWNVALAMAGGYALSRQFVDRADAAVGMVAAGTAPFLLGVIDFGITESWPLGWLALHAAALIAHARRGGAGLALAAGACLGAAALSGWYLAFLALVVEAALVPPLLLRYRRWGTLLQGGAALAMVLPSWLRFAEEWQRWRPRWLAPARRPPAPRPDWAELPIYGTDLLNFAAPYAGSVHPSKSVYLGLAALALAALGLGWSAWKRRWFVFILLLPVLLPLLLALGYWPAVAGAPVGIPGLAKLLVDTWPQLQGMSHWHRATGAAVPFLAALAAVGAAALPRFRGKPWVLSLLLVLDGALLSQTAWPRTAYRLELPPVLVDLPGTGGLIQLPFDNSRGLFSAEPARIYNRWQVLHGRLASENYEGMDALLARSRLVAAANAGCWNRDTLPPYYQPPPEMRDPALPEGAALEAELEALRGWGYEWIVLHRGRCRVPAQAVQRLDAALGPGQHHPSGDVFWALEAR